MFPFVASAHIFTATQHEVFFLHGNTCRWDATMVFLALEHILTATQHDVLGWRSGGGGLGCGVGGMLPFVASAHILTATQHEVFLQQWCFFHLNTSWVDARPRTSGCMQKRCCFFLS